MTVSNAWSRDQHQRTQHQSVSHSHTVIYIYSAALCGNINTPDTLLTGTTALTWRLVRDTFLTPAACKSEGVDDQRKRNKSLKIVAGRKEMRDQKHNYSVVRFNQSHCCIQYLYICKHSCDIRKMFSQLVGCEMFHVCSDRKKKQCKIHIMK